MSTAQKTLIDAIRRIALDSEALASALGDLQKRGVIDGIKTTLGGYNELQDDCCAEGDGNPAEGDITDELPDIDGDAPPSVPGIGEEDVEGDTGWTDCETGEPISFAPGGFPRPETCKECVSYPDPTWQEGFYWTGGAHCAVSAPPRSSFATESAARSAARSALIGCGCVPLAQFDPAGGGVGTTSGQICQDPEMYAAWVVSKVDCRELYNESLCEITEPPIIEICDENWESDSTTSYTLANGCITASSCDPDASAQAQQCNECITICNEDGEERRVCAIGNGQWILYDPNGEHKGGRYDATGERQEILDAGETGGYLPSERFTQGQ